MADARSAGDMCEWLQVFKVPVVEQGTVNFMLLYMGGGIIATSVVGTEEHDDIYLRRVSMSRFSGTQPGYGILALYIV